MTSSCIRTSAGGGLVICHAEVERYQRRHHARAGSGMRYIAAHQSENVVPMISGMGPFAGQARNVARLRCSEWRRVVSTKGETRASPLALRACTARYVDAQRCGEHLSLKQV